jgi:pilus assembly protein CpaB
MTRRVLALLAAILLALVGTAALVVYVSSAEQRALAGEQLVEVYVVTTVIPSGTPAEDVENLVVVEQVPVKIRAQAAVDDLSALVGRVAAVDLLPGEQLVAGRFVERSEFADQRIGIDVPDDMVEVTVELEAERAIGGLLEPGQTVAVFASFDPFQLTSTVVPVDGEVVPVPAAVAGEIEGTTPNSTDLLLRKILVTAVQKPVRSSSNGGGSNGEATDADDGRLSTPIDGTVFVTLAVDPFDAERLVFTAEFGKLWMASERETVPDIDQPGQSRGSVLLERVGAE